MELLPGTDNNFGAVYEAFAPVVWRVCVLYFGSRKADCEDAMQNTFLKFLSAKNPPTEAEHIKAWLIVTAGNVCKDMLRRSANRNVSLDQLAEVGVCDGEAEDHTLEKVLSLPPKIKTAIYLYYYEEMSAKEIAAYTGHSENTVFWQLHKGRKLLKDLLESEQSDRKG